MGLAETILIWPGPSLRSESDHTMTTSAAAVSAITSTRLLRKCCLIDINILSAMFRSGGNAEEITFLLLYCFASTLKACRDEKTIGPNFMIQ